MSVRCLITDGKNYELNKLFVEDTLKYFPDYDFNIMKATISGWQSSQLKDNEDRLPTILELIDYLLNSAKRENNNNIKIIADKALLILNNLSTYDKELLDILAKAPRDSQGRLLAPNGKPSNLTERQYALVRTKEFKNWFGDWERRATNFLGESTGNIDIADIINADGSINFKVLEEITDEYFNNADEALFNKGRKTLRQRPEKHYDGDGNLIENNTLEHLQNVTKSALASNIRPDLKPQLILAAALHDLAKPFHGGQIHGFQSLNLVNKLFKGNISPLVKFAIKHHMLTIEENKKFNIDDATRIMQEALDNNLNLDDAIEILLAINTADILSGQSEDSIDYYSKKSKRDTINEEIPFKKSLLIQAKNKLNDVSKVVDENGEPLVVYHGSNYKFTTFNKEKLGNNTKANSAKKAFFAASNKNNAERYIADFTESREYYGKDGEIIIENIIETKDWELISKEIEDIVYDRYEIENGKIDIPLQEYIKQRGFDIKTHNLKSRNGIINLIESGIIDEYFSDKGANKIKNLIGNASLSPTMYEVFLNIKNPKIDSDNSLNYREESYTNRINKALEANNDGGIIKNTRDPLLTNIYYFFNSNQIKSATDNIGAFSTTNDRIDRFGEGKKSDIINKLLDRITDGTNYYTQDDINYLHSRNLNINQIFTGNNIKEVLESFKSSIRKAIDKYILENHYDLGVATLRRLKLEGNLSDKDSYYNFIQLLQNIIIDKLQKSGKTIEVKPDSNFTAAMGAKVNGSVVSLVYNPRLLLMDNERLDYILAHELVHTVTSNSINNVTSNTATEAEQLFYNDIWNIIVDLNDNKNFYWDFGYDVFDATLRGSHIKEFVANVMTNPELQRHLAQIKTDKKLSLWSRFINAIKSLLNKYLGINISDSYLEKLVNTISLHIEKLSLSLQNYGYDAMTEGETPKTLNIYAGTNENADLSNFAERPFTIPEDFSIAVPSGRDISYGTIGISNDGSNIKYRNVEAAFQGIKATYSETSYPADTDFEALRKQGKALRIEDFAKMSGSTARQNGRKITDLDVKSWNEDSSTIMKALIKLSFEQNPQALQRLLATGNATLTHTLDKGKWGTEFPRLLMEVREELRQSQLKSLTKFSTSKSSSYPVRTEENAKWSDITLDFTESDKGSGGNNELTKRVAGKKYIHFKLTSEGDNSYDADEILDAIKLAGLPTKNIKLNIAGSEISKLKGNQEVYNEEIERILKDLLNLGVTISEIRTGGQTGIDEAGIIAALRLGIPNEVHTTSDYKFRDKSGEDISNNELAFKARFLQQQTLSLILQLILPESLPITTEQLNEPLLFNEEKIKATRDFLNPVIRKQVVLKIARMFSNIVSKEYDNLKQALDNRIAYETDDKVKKELLFLRRKFNRYQVIKTMTPVAIFNKLKETYEKYVSLTDELGKNLEKNILNKNSVFQKMPEALKDRIALMRFNNKKKAYQLILDNFKILAMEASKSFALTEGVNLTFNTNMVTLLLEQDTYDDEGNSDVSENKEEKGREHWMIDVRTVSSFNSLTNKIRQAINNIARVTKDGILEVDDMGDTIYLSGSYVHSELIKTLAAEVTDPNDIIPILLKAAIRKPWINLIIYKILEDPILFTEMYRAYNKSTLNYWILKPRTLQDGSIKTLTISLNKMEGMDLLFETWRDNYEYGNKLEDDAIYTSDGTIIKDNVKKGLALVNEVKEDIYYHRKDTRETRVAIVLNKDNVLKLTKAFKMLGIPLEEQTIAEAIGYNIDNTLYEPDFNAYTLVNALVTIYDDLLKNKEVKEDELFDMANAYGRALETVARVISFVTEDTMESQVRHNKKSLYAHVNSGYMINLIKKLKNSDKFKDFIEKEYMPVEWFYKDGLWRNQFIQNLYNNQEDRDKLQHIVMLDYNGKEYADWSTLDSTLVLLNQFLSLPTKDEHGWAYYNIPVLSDTESAEFLRMRRYISNFEEIINTKFINLVKLEIDRIDLVKKRANDPNVEKITNFDMVKTVDKDGNEHIKYGGAEFKFFPELNFIKINGNSFLDEYYRLSLTETTDKVNLFIKELISSILERRFKTALLNWDKIGLFERVDDNPNSKFKYFDTNSRTTAELMLKQWYWNSSFAQSQIIELLTTDLAFYKTKGKDFLTDFIKRAKEFHAPIERLNTEAEWIVNGERKKVCYDDNGNKLKNRVLYLKDCEVPSLTLEELKEALDKNPKLTKEEKGIIIGAYQNINMADALAYRTLDSFRRTLIMAGQWSDDEETVYNNIKNGNFRLEDITVLWNTRKPYLYTLTNKSNLVDGGNIRVPVLHKNSEMIMLTLAILGTIMSTGKLAALERFMTKNNVDVVMFESAVKAGGLDIINLNDVEASEVEDYLTNYVNTYSLAIHEFDYEDYGIQTATPEHGIDAMLLVGTLIRRIIASNQDMTDPNFRFKYKNKEWTVLEWLDYYNMVNTANIKESFQLLDKKFSNIKEIEKLLLSEVRSNPRYDTDVEIALTLNSDGVFNIPLLDPSITYKIQSLLTSIVKNRVTKQKIAGGAFIQTSAWGFKKEPIVEYNKDGSVKCIQCYMPCPSEELYNMLLDDKTHEVDINKKYKGKDGKWHYIVPEKYRELIGYRVPTESFYSCAPLKVIGYLPRLCGTIMVVPRDIVSMAGSDFDKL